MPAWRERRDDARKIVVEKENTTIIESESIRTARRAAWAAWAGWICKERGRSLHPDVQRQVVRETPAGKPAG